MTDANDNEKIRTTALPSNHLTRTFGYDLAGRTVLESYTRLKSDGTTSVTEGQVTRYDLAGRAITQTNARKVGGSWTFVQQIISATDYYYDAVRTRYNAFGEVTGRGITGGTSNPNVTAVYQETFDYDTGGRLWKSNTGDGVVRFHLYDKNGAETLTVAQSGGTTAINYADAATLVATLDTYGDTSTTDAVTTIIAHDKRGQPTSTLEPDRAISASSASNTISRSRTYNAFGEVLSETDARGYTTSFTYNTMGRMLSKVSPQVSWTNTSGSAANTNPTENYGYDLAGRLVAVSNAHDYVTTRLLLAGAGHGEAEALVTKEFHPDGGVFETQYDVFGDARELINEIGNVEARDYDKMGQLTTQTHALRTGGTQLVDNYVYDSLGQRTRHWNSQFGSGVVERTDYDTKGRVTAQYDYMGASETFSYVWDGGLTTTGLGSFGGLVKTSFNKLGLDATETTDYFGRIIDHVDFGNHDYAYTYNKAGQLSSRTNNLSESYTNSYFNTGQLYQAVINGTTSTYAYDKNGNVVAETIGSVRTATMSYDAMGRRTTFTDSGPGGSYPVTVDWKYDKVGNIRATIANYTPLGGGSATSTESWYTYNSMNRYTLAKGILSGGAIVVGSNGVEVTWNVAGQRIAETGKWYTYTEDGHLYEVYSPGGASVPASAPSPGSLTERYQRDALGRVTKSGVYARSRAVTYNTRSEILSEDVRYSTFLRTVTNYAYSVSGVYQGGRITASTTDNYSYNPYTGLTYTGSTTVTAPTYVWWDDAQQNVITNPAGTSTFSYSASGHVSSVYINDGAPRTYTYTTDAAGRIIARSHSSGYGDINYGIAGFSVGSLNGVNVDFDQGYQPLAQEDGRGSSYTIESGDTLQSIAAKLWGDSSLWFKIADANGMSGAETLVAERVLVIPAGVSRAGYNAGTFEPYDPNKALGDVNPSVMPQPEALGGPGKRGGCGIIGQILMIAIAVAVTALIAGPASTAIANLLAGPTAVGISTAAGVAASVVTGTVVTASVGAAATIAGAVIGGAVAGAIGSAASQLFGIATGVQQGGFSWKGVAIAAISGGVAGGFGATGFLNGAKGALGIVQDVARGALTNAGTQGIARLTGLQKGFDWAGVAVGGAVSGAGGAVGGIKSLRKLGVPGQVVSGAAGAIAGAATRSVLAGTSFGDNLMAALPEVIGHTVGSEITKALQSIGQRQVPASGTLGRSAAPKNIAGGKAGPTMGGYAHPELGNYKVFQPERLYSQDPDKETGGRTTSILFRDRTGRGRPDIVQPMGPPVKDMTLEDARYWRRVIYNNMISKLHDGYLSKDSDGYISSAKALDDYDRYIAHLINPENNPEIVVTGRRIKPEPFEAGGGSTGGGGATGSWELPPSDRLSEPRRPTPQIRTPAASALQSRGSTAANTDMGKNPYGRFGSIEALQKAAGGKYQQFIDEGYAIALERLAQGRLPIRKGFDEKHALGVVMDDYARVRMKAWLRSEGISEGRKGVVQVNRRLYNPDRSEYTVPDLRIGNKIWDGSMTRKRYDTPQVQKFYRYGGDVGVYITRPTSMGGTYKIKKPGK